MVPLARDERRSATTLRALASILPLILLLGLPAHAGDTYIEGRAGILGLADMSGEGEIDSIVGFARLTGDASGDVSYDNTFALGAEVGVEGVFDTSMRISAAAEVFKPEVKSAALDAELAINGVDVPDTPDGSPLGSSELADIGLDFGHRTAILSANAFYDLDLGGFTPYVGAGYGMLLVENANQLETGFLLHAGFRFDISPLFYLGGRVSWFRGGGPQDDTGINFDTFETTSASIGVGIRL